MILSSILVDNILTAPVIAFVVALIVTLLRFDLRIPDALYPILSTFLLLAIGIKGGKALSESSPTELWQPLLASIAIGVITPLIAYALFRKTAKLDITNAAALAAHYGSVSAVTFTVLLSTLDSQKITYEGYVSGLLAVLEIVGIVVALFLAHKFSADTDWKSGLSEVVRGKSIAFLVAGLLIGIIVGPDRLSPTDPLFVGLFSGALTLFLIELGAIAANRLRDLDGAGLRVVILGIVVPLINGSIGAVLGSTAGMSGGGVAVMATLAASASYIAAPAAIRIALPDANPGIYVTASLGITFPFNLIVGIPLYIEIAEYLT
jgi:uncharacterized protein